MNNMVNYFLSDSEKELMEEIQSIGYGEIYNVAFKTGAPYGQELIDDRFAMLFRLLKSTTKFDIITIRDSAPYIGQRAGTTNSGRKYIQKFKF
jgi:hypothetical protein